jgi:hypothetical protein
MTLPPRKLQREEVWGLYRQYPALLLQPAVLRSIFRLSASTIRLAWIKLWVRYWFGVPKEEWDRVSAELKRQAEWRRKVEVGR